MFRFGLRVDKFTFLLKLSCQFYLDINLSRTAVVAYGKKIKGGMEEITRYQNIDKNRQSEWWRGRRWKLGSNNTSGVERCRWRPPISQAGRRRCLPDSTLISMQTKVSIAETMSVMPTSTTLRWFSGCVRTAITRHKSRTRTKQIATWEITHSHIYNSAVFWLTRDHIKMIRFSFIILTYRPIVSFAVGLIHHKGRKNDETINKHRKNLTKMMLCDAKTKDDNKRRAHTHTFDYHYVHLHRESKRVPP